VGLRPERPPVHAAGVPVRRDQISTVGLRQVRWRQTWRWRSPKRPDQQGGIATLALRQAVEFSRKRSEETRSARWDCDRDRSAFERARHIGVRRDQISTAGLRPPGRRGAVTATRRVRRDQISTVGLRRRIPSRLRCGSPVRRDQISTVGLRPHHRPLEELPLGERPKRPDQHGGIATSPPAPRSAPSASVRRDQISTVGLRLNGDLGCGELLLRPKRPDQHGGIATPAGSRTCIRRRGTVRRGQISTVGLRRGLRVVIHVDLLQSEETRSHRPQAASEETRSARWDCDVR